MTVKQIANKIAFYVQQSRDTFIHEGEDLLISAMNTARKSAEQLHDFHSNQVQAWLSIDPITGGDLSNSKVFTGNTLTETPVSVKSVETVYMQNTTDSNTWLPIWIDPKKLLSIRAKKIKRNRFGDTYLDEGYYGAYLGDSRRYLGNSLDQVYFYGNEVQFQPKLDEAKSIKMDIQKWMPEYERNVVIINDVNTITGEAAFGQTIPLNLVPNTQVGTVRVLTVDRNANTAIFVTGIEPQITNNPTLVEYANPIGASPGNSNEDYSDWMTIHGHEYLFWAAIVETNHFTRTFVPREVGYLSPPEKARDQALQRLIEWDVYLWEQDNQTLIN